MKRLLLFALIISSFGSLSLRAQGVYSLTPQPVCWSYNGTDSSLLSLLVFDTRDTVGLFKGYVNAVSGQYVNTTAGGSVSAGYCCCGNTGSANTVTITDNNDGTYTAIVGTDTTIIYTKADSLYTTAPITIADTTFLANSVIQDILITLSQEVNDLRSETGCELVITQAGHGFAPGDLITQDPNTGVYADAAADTSANFPVAYVCEVVDANNFKVDTEGWVTGAHGGTVYRDYFLQDAAGTTDTVVGSYPIFAWRTFTPTLRYYDIPEYVANGAAGGGGSFAVTATNGLNDQDAGSDVDVELGGTLDKNTFINAAGFDLDIQQGTQHIGTFQSFPDGGAGVGFYGTSGSGTYFQSDIKGTTTPYLENIGKDGANTNQWVRVDHSKILYQIFATTQGIGTDSYSFFTVRDSICRLGIFQMNNADVIDLQITPNQLALSYQTSDTTSTAISLNSVEAKMEIINSSNVTVNAFTLNEFGLTVQTIPEYANDAAADADGGLPSGGVYKITGDRTLYIKP